MKLVFTTSVVVAVAVFISAYFGRTAMEDVARADAESRRVEGMKAIEHEIELLSHNAATAVVLPLATQMEGEIQGLLAESDARYTLIDWLIAINADGQVVGFTEGAPPVARGETFRDELTDKLAGARPGHYERIGDGTDWTYGAPIYLGGNRVGELRARVSTAALEQELADRIAAARSRAQEAQDRLTLVALTLLAIGVVLAALQGFSMARPLRQLAHQADRIAHGDLDQRAPEGRNDEIGLLAHNFNFMAGRLGELLVENARKASLEAEMSMARRVQQAMLPAEALITHGGVRLVGHCRPASTCGGDWWTYRMLSGGRTLIVIGDATGHGMHSALIAATARGAVEALGDADERLLTPEQVLKAIHAAISGIGDHSLLMTCFAAVIDPPASTLHYANAGQNFPYVMRRGATGTLSDAQIIAASGNPLGDPNVQQTLRRGSVPMRPGDLLVAFTDGVVERANPQGKLFGDRRLRSVLAGQEVDAEDALEILRERIVSAVDVFAGGTDQQDDVTFVLLQYRPAQAKSQRTAS
jgi:serine phosphatase RsbU (regulator of sigma subunit)